jgi:hypothetical protein
VGGRDDGLLIASTTHLKGPSCTTTTSTPPRSPNARVAELRATAARARRTQPRLGRLLTRDEPLRRAVVRPGIVPTTKPIPVTAE